MIFCIKKQKFWKGLQIFCNDLVLSSENREIFENGCKTFILVLFLTCTAKHLKDHAYILCKFRNILKTHEITNKIHEYANKLFFYAKFLH